MKENSDWKYVVDDGDVRIDYKVHGENMVEIRYTRHYFDSEDKVSTFEIFLEELEYIVNHAKASLNKTK